MERSPANSIICLLLFSFTFTASAQFPVVNTHPQGLVVLGSLSSGWHFMGPIDYNNGTLTIYGLDMSVFRVLNIPPAPAGMQWANITYITDALFDTDPSTIEYMIHAPVSGSTSAAIHVFREDGTELFSQNPAGFGVGYTTLENFGPIYQVDGIAYLALNQGFYQGPTTIYQLPGQLPCRDCFGTPEYSGLGMGMEGGIVALSPVLLFPNPASSTITIVRPPELQLYKGLEIFDAAGKLVKALALSSDAMEVLQVGDLSAGRYQCQLVNGGPRMACGALVIER